MNEFFQKELAEQRQKQPQTPGWQREANSSTIPPGDAECVAAFLRLLAQVSPLQTSKLHWVKGINNWALVVQHLRSCLSTGKCVLPASLTSKVSSLHLRHH